MSNHIQDLENKIALLELEISMLRSENHSFMVTLKQELKFKLETMHTTENLKKLLYKVILEKEPLSTSSYLGYTDYHFINHN